MLPALRIYTYLYLNASKEFVEAICQKKKCKKRRSNNRIQLATRSFVCFSIFDPFFTISSSLFKRRSLLWVEAYRMSKVQFPERHYLYLSNAFDECLIQSLLGL